MQTSEKLVWSQISSKKFDGFMYNNGFLKYQANHSCYVKKFYNSYIILLLYVDDMLIA